MTKYRVWTPSAIAAWSLPVLALLAGGVTSMAHPAAAWHQRLVGLLLVVATVYIVGRRTDTHQRIASSISHYLARGTRVVNRTARPLSDREIEAIETGLTEARWRVADKFPARGDKALAAHDEAFVFVQDEVYQHTGGKKVRVGGLTYPAGGMVIERKADVYALEDIACHEGVHAVLYRLGVQAPTGHEHHNLYPEFFEPVRK